MMLMIVYERRVYYIIWLVLLYYIIICIQREGVKWSSTREQEAIDTTLNDIIL